MKHFLTVILLAGLAITQQTKQAVPAQVLSAKSMLTYVWWPDGAVADVNAVRYDADKFVTKWKRYQLSDDVNKADLVAYVIVKPMTVYPGFWQRMAWGMAASQAGTHCNGQSYGDNVQVNCYSTPTPAPLMPSTLLTGSILIFDGNSIRDWLSSPPQTPLPAPIMAELAKPKGNEPLLGAAKRLRKMIDTAAKTGR